MKRLYLQRYDYGKDYTLGLLGFRHGGGVIENLCYTLEPAYRPMKEEGGRNAIPEGLYRLTLRSEGLLHEKYNERWPDMHMGMILFDQLRTPVGWSDNWGWTYVEIHTGNTVDDTRACPLVGESASLNPPTVMNSRKVYAKIYPLIRNYILDGSDPNAGLIEVSIIQPLDPYRNPWSAVFHGEDS